MIVGQNFFDEPVNKEIRTSGNIEKNVTCHGEFTQQVAYLIIHTLMKTTSW